MLVSEAGNRSADHAGFAHPDLVRPTSANATERWIYRRAALCSVFLIVSLVVPRFVPNSEGGFASAASAVLVFLAMLLGTAVFSLVLLARTIRVYHTISVAARVAGIAPGVILALGFVLLLGFLRY